MSEPNGRVTNSQLRDAIADTKEIISAEQKSEHLKTRALVVIVGVMSGATKVLTTLGVISVPHFHL